MSPLHGWQNFYVIVGSSAGALIGLQFVVMTLLADIPMREGSEQAGSAFGTPTVIHLCAVLLLAALICAPWHGVFVLAHLFLLIGVIGVIYSGITLRRFHTQTAYRPELEDWLFHVVLPAIAYAILAVAAHFTGRDLYYAMFAVAASALLLLFIGIHNAWDAVTYHVFVQRRKQQKNQ